MPQLILEYSANIIEQANLKNLLSVMNHILTESLPTELSSCKSRVTKHDIYCIGDGSSNNAFVHVNLKVMPGRSMNTLNHVGERLMDMMKEYFSESLQQLKLQLTIEIDELQKTYFKFSL